MGVQERHEGDDDDELREDREYWKGLADLASAQDSFEVCAPTLNAVPTALASGCVQL